MASIELFFWEDFAIFFSSAFFLITNNVRNRNNAFLCISKVLADSLLQTYIHFLSLGSILCFFSLFIDLMWTNNCVWDFCQLIAFQLLAQSYRGHKFWARSYKFLCKWGSGYMSWVFIFIREASIIILSIITSTYYCEFFENTFYHQIFVTIFYLFLIQKIDGRTMQKPQTENIPDFRKECQATLDKTQQMIESLRAIVCKKTSKKVIPQQIRYTRKIIQDSLKNFQQLKNFYHQLSIPFAFEVAQQTFTLLTFAFNSLSHIYLATLREAPSKENEMLKINQNTNNAKKKQEDEINELKFLKKQNRLEPLINENQTQKQEIEFSESPTSHIISQLLDFLERMNENAEKLQESEIDFSQISSIKNSTQFGEEMIKNFSKQGHDKIYKAAIKAAQFFLQNYKKKMKKQVKQVEMQTEPQSENVQQMRKIMSEHERKYEALITEKNFLKEKLTQTSDDAFNFRKKIDSLEQLFSTNIKEISQMKTKALHEKKKNQDLVALLRNRIVYLQGEKKDGGKISSEQEDMVDEKSFDSTFFNNPLGKSIGSHKASIHYYEKELQSQKKYNLQMRKSLQVLICALSNNKLIGYNPKKKQNEDFTAAKVRETVEIVSAQLQKEMQRNRQRFSHQPNPTVDNLSSRRSRNKDYLLKELVITSQQAVQTSLRNIGYGEVNIGQFQKENGIKKRNNKFLKGNTSHFYHLEKGHTNLDGLRDELIKRVSANKRNKNMKDPTTQNQKLPRNTENLFYNTSADFSNKVIDISIDNEKQSTRAFDNVNLHFEELMIKDTGGQTKKKKNELGSSKSKLYALQAQQMQKNQSKNERIFAIQGFETKAQAARMFQYLEGKNDSDDKFLTKFMKSFFQEINKKKGGCFVSSLLNKEGKKTQRSNHGRCQSSAFSVAK